MMKNVKNVKVWYPLMPRFTVPLWRQNGIYPPLDFSANLIKRLSNHFDARVAQAYGTFLLADLLKTSSLDNISAYV